MPAHTLPPCPYLEPALGHLGIYYWFLPAELVSRGVAGEPAALQACACNTY